GSEIEVLPGTLVIADGETGGGSIFVGGGQRGEDPALMNAENVTVGEGATLSVNGLGNGNGGQIVVFANDSLTFLGNLSATGGPEGGNGGFAELSGKQSVTIPNLAGRIDLSAASGQSGTLLFDPIDTSVIAGVSTGIFGSPVSANTLYANDIATFLNSSGSLIVETNVTGTGLGNIDVSPGVSISWNSVNDLTFNAFRDFTLGSGAAIGSAGAGNVNVNAGRAIYLDAGSQIQTNTGSISLRAHQDSPMIDNFAGIGIDDAQLVSSGGDILLLGTGGGYGSDNFGIRVQGTNSRIETSGGQIRMTGHGGGDSLGSRNRGIWLSDGMVIGHGNANVTVIGTGGQGYTEIDGIQIDNGASVEVDDGNLELDGKAGGSLGMGILSASNAGDIRTNDAGTIFITGSGVNAPGVALTNSSAALGGLYAGLVTVQSSGNHLVIQSVTTAEGNILLVSPAETHVEGSVTSYGGDVTVGGNHVFLDGQIQSNLGEITVQIADFESATNGIIEVNNLLQAKEGLNFNGGAGMNDIVTYAGYNGPPVTFFHDDLSNIERLVGPSAPGDLFVGPQSAANYAFSGPDTFTVGGVKVTNFENVNAGPGSDILITAANGSLTGQLDAGGGFDTLNYSRFGGPVTVDVANYRATGFGSILGIENFIGSSSADTFKGGNTADIFNITADNAGNVGNLTFSSFERLNGNGGNDRFNFLNQATVQLVSGDAGSDTLFLNDSNLGGTNTYNITRNRISRNPTYNFTGIEIVQMVLGPGNDTVNSGFYGFTQLIDGGPGNDTLNLPGVTDLGQGNPIGNVFHFGFEAPRGENAAPAADLGDILQLQIDQQIGNFDIFDPSAFEIENRFDLGDAPLLTQQLDGITGAFAAATVIGQAIVISVDGNPYLIFRPFSLDGSGLTPSNLALASLAEHLGINANVELAQAIEFTGGLLLVMPDGPYSIDLSGVPADPAVIAALQESLAIAAARELFGALEIAIALPITNADGALSINLDGIAPGQPVIVLLTEQLGDASFNELNAALGAGN
ncbi:MAG: hypothetical protein KDM63_09075, partial [Verrucomicrobiae bacterium]|nr:hypothetical protein [Verrucomicrobiae bacterium]